MAKRVENFKEAEAVGLVTSVAGVSIKDKFIMFDRKSYQGFNSLTKSAAYDCLKNYHGYR